MFGWFKRPERPLELHVHVHVYVNGQEVSRPTVQTSVSSSHATSTARAATTPARKVDEASVDEVASVILAGGIDKAVDMTGDGAFKTDSSEGVDSQLSSLRNLGRRSR